jgi:hypothetical protein
MTATTLHTWPQRGPGAAEASDAALTMWAADGHRLTLTQNGVPVLLARPSADWFDLHVLALGNYQSPIPPIRATVARSIADGGPMAWGSWVHDALTASPLAPLRAGHWCLTYSDNAPPLSRRHAVAWDFSDAPPFIPLGGGAAPDRVAAYRRLAREDALAPVVSWWVSGLAAYVLLDGTCRLEAALAEDVPVPMVTLIETSPDRQRRHFAEIVALYEQRALGHARPDADRAQAWFARTLAAQLAAAAQEGMTTALALPGGVARWDELAASHGWGDVIAEVEG